MSDHGVLDAVLDNAQTPHQPLVIIVDSAVFSGLPIFRESLRRALNRGGPVLVVTALHSPESILPTTSGNAKILDLMAVSGYEEEADLDVEAKITAAFKELPPGAQVYIDALDILAEDDSPLIALKVVRSLLRLVKGKPPSRLTLLLPHTSSLLSSLIPPTLSPTLTLLHAYHPSLFTHLSQLYLQPIEASPHFWQIVERARDRKLPETLAYGGLEGIEVAGDWSDGGAIVSVLVRKATGGVKGLSRSFAAISSEGSTSSQGRDTTGSSLSVRAVSDLIPVNPIMAPSAVTAGQVERPPASHVDLDLPFNLSLTDEQKRRRGEVPLPYAHEGEGVGIEFGEEEDEDDEEI